MAFDGVHAVGSTFLDLEFAVSVAFVLLMVLLGLGIGGGALLGDDEVVVVATGSAGVLEGSGSEGGVLVVSVSVTAGCGGARFGIAAAE